MPVTARKLYDDGSPNARILSAAIQAVKQHPFDLNVAKDAFLMSIRNNADLLWALFAPYKDDAALDLLAEAETAVKQEPPPARSQTVSHTTREPISTGGKFTPLHEVQEAVKGRTAAPQPVAPEDWGKDRASVQPTRGANGTITGAGFSSLGGTVRTLPTPPPPATSPAPLQLSPEQIREGARGRAELARRTILDTFMINGVKLGDCTPEDVYPEIYKKEKDARFLRLVVSGLPPQRPIRQWYRGNEADKLYERTQKEAA